MKILKFGGTSVGSEENVKRIGSIILNQKENVVVVVSALNGITDQLLSIAQTTARGKGSSDDLTPIWTRHEEMTRQLLTKESIDQTLISLRLLFDELEKI